MWKFIGGASSTTGVPARDLTDDEWNAIPKWLRDIALSHGYYQNVSVTVPDVVVTVPIVVDTAFGPVEADKPTAKPRKK